MRAVKFLVGVAATVGLVATGTGPASADYGGGGGSDDPSGGYGATAVHVSGDVSESLRASVPSPPPLCWWAPITEAPADDAKAVKKWWDEEIAPYLKGHAGPGWLAVPSFDAFHDAVKADKKGKGVTWYRLHTNDAALPSTGSKEWAEALKESGCTQTNNFMDYPVPVTLNFFPTGEPPAPVVDARVLAEYAYEVMDLVSPELNWNPRLAAHNEAAMINLPTWLWVDQQAAVQTREVTATAGPVSVTVTATTDGLSVTSPAGTTQCSTDEAATAYASGVSENSACTLTFGRPSTGYDQGFPVDATTVWEASWTSNTGEGDDLQGRTVNETTYIPVAHSQALVTNVD